MFFNLAVAVCTVVVFVAGYFTGKQQATENIIESAKKLGKFFYGNVIIHVERVEYVTTSRETIHPPYPPRPQPAKETLL